MDNPAKKVKLSEVLREARTRYIITGQDEVVVLGKTSLFFVEGELSMIEDDNGKIIALKPGELMIEGDSSD